VTLKLRRFWFTFSNPPPFSPLVLGCGVTAVDRSDAEELLRISVTSKVPGLVIDEVVEDVDVRTLDAGHVVPNMGVVIWRGVWFPLGY
jgi:hypothetical protein